MDIVRGGMPSKTFSEMMAVLRKFVSFMNLTVSFGIYQYTKGSITSLLDYIITCIYIYIVPVSWCLNDTCTCICIKQGC